MLIFEREVDYKKLYKTVNNYDYEIIWKKYIRVGKSLVQHSAFSGNNDNHKDILEFIEPINWRLANYIEADYNDLSPYGDTLFDTVLATIALLGVLYAACFAFDL